MKIAVTTSDGFIVDENFGSNGSFYIFNIKGPEVNFVETRNISLKTRSAYSRIENGELDNVYNLISDCQALYSAQIGAPLENQLLKRGIMPIVYQGEINNLTVMQ